MNRSRVFAILLVLVPVAPTWARAGTPLQPFVALPWAPVGTQVEGAFGSSAAPAGDVDGDGYSDVVVGAPFENGAFADEGGAYLYRGSPNGTLATHAWLYRPGQLGAFAGEPVAPAGDVNRDGYADVLVAVIGWNSLNHENVGKVAVFHGGPGGLPLTPTYELFAPAPATNLAFGSTLAPAGDVNGDGFDDVLVATPLFGDAGMPNRGVVYVYHGGMAGLGAAPARTWIGAVAEGQFGRSVSTAGDVNADTFADVVVGAPYVSANSGAVFLYLGSAAGALASPDTTIAGSAGSGLGSSVSLAGDVNGDGYGDVLIGSPQFNANAGKADLAFGGPGGIASSAGVPNGQPGAFESFGRVVATLGDIDADGLADIAVGASDLGGGGHGRISVSRGGRTQVEYVGELFSPVADGAFGNSIATAGDADGDGFTEILVGTEDMSFVPGQNEGRVFQYKGPRTVPRLMPGWPILAQVAGSRLGQSLAIVPHRTVSVDARLVIGEPGGNNGFGRVMIHQGDAAQGVETLLETTHSGTADASGFGTRVVDAGDMDRNGYSDFAVSSPNVDHATFLQAGRVDVFKGAQGALPPPVLAVGGAHEFDRIGGALAGRGDVNGDGYHDLVVGARQWDSGALPDRGAVWVVPGSASGPAAPTWMREGATAGAGLGTSVALADLDADGYSDVIVGSVTSSLAVDGRVEVFYGGPSGPALTPGLVLRPLTPRPTFGGAVAGLGDVNGDGVCDLGVGSPGEDGARGRVDLYAGTLGRSQSSIPMWSRAGTQANARFGETMAGGGDVDGDGRGDFVIGEPGWSGGQTFEGRIHLHHGAPDVPEATAWTFESDIVGAELGGGIAALRDINLDGFADLMVGAPSAAGRVYAFAGGGGLGASPRRLQFLEPSIPYTLRFPPVRLDETSFVAPEVSFQGPAGRSRVGFDFEIRTQNTVFTGVPTHPGTNSSFDTGLPTSQNSFFPLINLPQPGRGFHLRTRMRSRSPFFPRSKWFTTEAHTSGDLDLWLSGTVVGAGPGPATGVPRLLGVTPNPAGAASPSRIAFALPRSARVRLDVFDVRGARVRALLDEERPAGTSSPSWDGRDDGGRLVAPGLYFVRLVAGGREDRTRLVRLP